jgi:hypothetical protein
MDTKPPKNGRALEHTYDNLDHNEPNHYPLQARCVTVVLMVSQHVEHFSQHLRARRRACQMPIPA